MHKFVAGFHYLYVHMHSYLCKCTDLEVFIDRNANDGKYVIIYIIIPRNEITQCDWLRGDPTIFGVVS